MVNIWSTLVNVWSAFGQRLVNVWSTFGQILGLGCEDLGLGYEVLGLGYEDGVLGYEDLSLGFEVLGPASAEFDSGSRFWAPSFWAFKVLGFNHASNPRTQQLASRCPMDS